MESDTVVLHAESERREHLARILIHRLLFGVSTGIDPQNYMVTTTELSPSVPNRYKSNDECGVREAAKRCGRLGWCVQLLWFIFADQEASEESDERDYSNCKTNLRINVV